MSDIVLKVENISKLYRLGEVGTGTISHDLNRWWAKIRGKEDPYALVGQVNDRNQKAESDYVWSLKDINFEVKQGEVLGIIGKNGAGKSTLLKIISQITSPTTGSIKAKGRIASLLEVGTGMNPELTARENIYLNGAILGMRKREIDAKFDEIVDFSGCTLYVDTPIKRFSSGMRVRLGFAVAAFLEPEILIVDEVLAVGDAEFQKKAIGKMKDISSGGGRTVLFVSHNVVAVKSLCSRAILLENGLLKSEGETERIVSEYLLGDNEIKNFKKLNLQSKDEQFELKEVGVRVKDEDFSLPINMSNIIEFYFDFENKTDSLHHITIKLKGEDGEYCMTTSTSHETNLNWKGRNVITMQFPEYFFNEGDFFVDVLVVRNKKEVIISETDAFSFNVNPAQKELGSWMGKELGYFRGRFNCKNIQL